MMMMMMMIPTVPVATKMETGESITRYGLKTSPAPQNCTATIYRGLLRNVSNCWGRTGPTRHARTSWLRHRFSTLLCEKGGGGGRKRQTGQSQVPAFVSEITRKLWGESRKMGGSETKSKRGQEKSKNRRRTGWDHNKGEWGCFFLIMSQFMICLFWCRCGHFSGIKTKVKHFMDQMHDWRMLYSQGNIEQMHIIC